MKISPIYIENGPALRESDTNLTEPVFDENGNCVVVSRNDVSHLPQEMLANMKLVPKISRPDYKE